MDMIQWFGAIKISPPLPAACRYIGDGDLVI